MAELILEESTTDEGTETEFAFVLIPENEVLEAEILDVEVKDSFFWNDVDDHSQGKQKEVSFKFNITEDGKYKGVWVWGSTSTIFNTHPNCKLRLWTEEILGVDEGLPVDFSLNTDDLEGQSVRVIISNYYSKKHEAQRHKVSDLQRVPSGYSPDSDAF